jgi:hypothetical protein
VPADDSTPEQDPAQRSEREAIQREARQVAGTCRAMTRLNGIANTPGEDRAKWRERITALEGRRDRYRDRWGVSLPHERLFKATGGVTQEWLQDMVNAADVIVWQLDHEF